MSKVLFVRADKIGDLVLTLPSADLWRRVHPQDEVHWLVNKNVEFVMDRVVWPQRPKIQFVKNISGFLSQLGESFRLAKILKKENFGSVVTFHASWWLALSFWLARIPKRTGVASQWFSFLFYNQRLRQKRSQATQHESRYNADLVWFALNQKGTAPVLLPTKLSASPESLRYWKDFFSKIKSDENRKFFVIHAGMAGSARNWPPQFYKLLAEKLIAGGAQVVVSGGPLDEDFIQKTGLREVSGVIDLVGKTQGDHLIGLLSLAQAVVAPSTGITHLAASLGVNTLGIYSPVRVQAPRRWGPLGDRVQIFMPEVACPGTLSCLGAACSLYDCMEQIPVETLATTMLKMISI